MGWYDFNSDHRKKLDAIERQHISDDARLKAVVEAFLQGKDLSWRMLIHRLYWAGETHVAEKIKTNAEPHQGEWTLDDVHESLSSVHVICGGRSGGTCTINRTQENNNYV